MLILAIDTALAACQGALVRDGELLAVCSEPMERGHQERLAPLVDAMFREASTAPSTVSRVAVTLGPGSFTGLRVGIAFAKGFALAADRPLVGIGALHALAVDEVGRCAAVIAAPHGRVYVQTFEDGRPLDEPALEDAAHAVERLRGAVARVVGPGGEAFSDALGVEWRARAFPDPVLLARLGAVADVVGEPLRPLYLREPDAKTIAERAAVKAATSAP